MNAGIISELGVERGDHVPALLHPNRISIVSSENLALGANAQDFRRAYEDCLHLVCTHLKPRDLTINLAAVGVTLDVDIDKIEAGLHGAAHRVSQQDRTSARSEDGLAGGELAQRLGQVFDVEQLEHSGALAAGHDEAVTGVQLLRGADFNRPSPGALYGLAMSLKITLQGEYTDSFHVFKAGLIPSQANARHPLPAASLQKLALGKLGDVQAAHGFT